MSERTSAARAREQEAELKMSWQARGGRQSSTVGVCTCVCIGVLGKGGKSSGCRIRICIGIKIVERVILSLFATLNTSLAVFQIFGRLLFMYSIKDHLLGPTILE